MNKYFYDEWQTKLIKMYFRTIKNIQSITIRNNKRTPTPIQNIPFGDFAKYVSQRISNEMIIGITISGITITTNGRMGGMCHYAYDGKTMYFRNKIVADEVCRGVFAEDNYYDVCENYAETKTMQINLITICEDMNNSAIFAKFSTNPCWGHAEHVFADIFLVMLMCKN